MNSGSLTNFLMVMVFVFLIIGFFAGRWVSLMVYKRKYTEKNELSASSISSEQPAPLADPAKYTELIRLWREKESGAMVVETSGHLLASSTPLNPAQKKRFIDLIKELSVWIGISPDVALTPAPEPVKTAPVPAASPVKTDPLPAPQAAIPPIPAASTPTPPPPPVPVPAAYVPPPAPLTASVYAPAPIVKPVSEPTKKAVSMVEQIDEILQDLIQRSDTPNRKIRLVEERNQGVIVWVEQEHFNGIDTVTDTTARDLIRAAAKEWEKRAESHL